MYLGLGCTSGSNCGSSCGSALGAVLGLGAALGLGRTRTPTVGRATKRATQELTGGRQELTELGAAFAHFCDQKASGDKAVTSGDELGGLELAGFSWQANLEAQAPLLTSDTKKRTLRSWPF